MAQRQELPDSIELDDTAGEEHLYALFSNAPLKVEDVKAALTAHPEQVGTIPGVVHAVAQTFVKESP
jgi:hypothetical protein